MAEFVRYITKEEMNTNVYKLMNTVFMVRMAYIDVVSHQEIKQYGLVSSGDPDDDRCNAFEKIKVGLKIPQMLEHYRNQVPFYLINETDEHMIYEIIYQHIYDWAEFAKSSRGMSANLARVPYQDLKDLSQLADHIYKVRDREKDVKTITRELDWFVLGNIDEMNSVYGDMAVQVKEETKEEVSPHLEAMQTLDQYFNRRMR